jgi:hypothetical protein
MLYWILTNHGRVISRTTVQRVTNLERSITEVKQRSQEFDKRIRELLKDVDHVIQEGNERQLQYWDNYTEDNDEDFAKEFGEVVSDSKISEADEDFTPDTLNDPYLNKEVALAVGASEAKFGRVTKRLRDAEGRPIGTANENPLLHAREYAVEFRDEHIESLSANLIAKNLYSQLVDEGNRHVLLSDIVDPRRDERAVDKADAYVNRKNGVKRRRETTLGWQLLCKWTDEITNWVALKDARQSYPVLVAEYALANRIDDEPAFA